MTTFEDVITTVRAHLGGLSPLQCEEVQAEDIHIGPDTVDSDEDSPPFVRLPATVYRTGSGGPLDHAYAHETLLGNLPHIAPAHLLYDGVADGRRFRVRDDAVLYALHAHSQDGETASALIALVRQLGDDLVLVYAGLDEDGSGPRELLLRLAGADRWPDPDSGEPFEATLGWG